MLIFETACDYLHLNPARARFLETEDRLLAYPWSSLGMLSGRAWATAPWIRTDRLLAAHGLADDASGRQTFEENVEAWRAVEQDEHQRKGVGPRPVPGRGGVEMLEQ